MGGKRDGALLLRLLVWLEALSLGQEWEMSLGWGRLVPGRPQMPGRELQPCRKASEEPKNKK